MLYAKAPIMLKFQANSDNINISGGNITNQTTTGLHVFLVVNIKEFSQVVLNIKIIEGKTLTSLIFLCIGLLLVVFVTFG